jgi:hypothetical protein
VQIPAWYRMNGGTIEDKGLRVASSRDITVYGNNQGGAAGESFLAIPVDVLWTDYYAPTWTGPVNHTYMVSQIGELRIYTHQI